MSETIYQEKLRAMSGPVSGIMAGMGTLALVIGIYCYITKPVSDVVNVKVDECGLIALTLLFLFLVSVAFVLRIKLTVYKDRVTVGYLTRYTYRIEDIESVSVVSSEDGFREFFGYGIRFNRKAVGLISPGKDGAKIVLRSGWSVIICTEHPKEFTDAVQNLLKA